MTLPRSIRWPALGFMLLLATRFGDTASAASPKHMQKIIINDMAYQADILTVHVGDTVQWTNLDIVPHTVTAEDKTFHSPKILPGKRWIFIPKKPGTFPYFCIFHPNMRARLIVE